MSEKGKDIRATKLEKLDKHVNKPIQAIKKLKNHFHKSSKKNKSETTSTVLPIVRNADVTSRITDASHTAETSLSIISHPIESIRTAELSQQSIVSRSMESRIMNISSNNRKSISDVDPSHKNIASRNINLPQNANVIRNDTMDFQTSNTSRSTTADISRNSVTDAFRMNNLSRDIEMPRNEEMVYNTDLSRSVKEIGKNEELIGKNIDISDRKCKH
ncbi:unnamed protein product [Cercopithifilaria johnstoni]|uniref:Uncharacterized protein n=1 Tax=Cercopithifilaria johnstoni TaxID=2874296 RepID=A0A8J2PSR5_9BILA|nr:unnamed protein product [Cercopithifilaria johnstoni]